MLGRTPGLEHGVSQRILVRIAVFQQREQRGDLRGLLGGRGVGVGCGCCCGDVGARGHGRCVSWCARGVSRVVEGLHAVGESAGFDGACEGQIGAEGVGGPEAQEACVLFCDLRSVSVCSEVQCQRCDALWKPCCVVCEGKLSMRLDA